MTVTQYMALDTIARKYFPGVHVNKVSMLLLAANQPSSEGYFSVENLEETIDFIMDGIYFWMDTYKAFYFRTPLMPNFFKIMRSDYYGNERIRLTWGPIREMPYSQCINCGAQFTALRFCEEPVKHWCYACTHMF